MRDDLAYIFNGEKFVPIKKQDLLNELVDTHIEEIRSSFEKNKKKMKESVVKRLERLFELMDDEKTKFKANDTSRVFPNFREFKIDLIKLIIYNESKNNDIKKLNKLELFEKILSETDDEEEAIVV